MDTGATNNFLSQREAARLRLNITNNGSHIKAVNSGAMPVHGSAEVQLKVGPWIGLSTLIVVSLNDFDLILRMEFFYQAKVHLLPHLKGVMIGTKEVLDFVHMEVFTPHNEKGILISAKQACKGLKNG